MPPGVGGYNPLKYLHISDLLGQSAFSLPGYSNPASSLSPAQPFYYSNSKPPRTAYCTQNIQASVLLTYPVQSLSHP